MAQANKKGTVRVMSRGKHEPPGHHWNWMATGVTLSMIINLVLVAYTFGVQATTLSNVNDNVKKHENRWEDYYKANVTLASDLTTLRSSAAEIKDALKRLEAAIDKVKK